MTTASLHERLAQLAGKYSVPVPPGCRLAESFSEITDAPALLPGWLAYDRPALPAHVVPLLPWRCERRFVELRNLVQGHTVEHVCLWRSRSLVRDLLPGLYRELGICQWVLGSPAVSIFAAITAGRSANVILRLANGVGCGIEVGITTGTQTIDRHEAIARRGVASDQVVDSEVRPSSVYVITAEATRTFTDVDHELYGLTESEVAVVRAAFAALREPPECRDEHRQLSELVQLAVKSDRLRKRLDVAP